jgi:hypothetical protein
MWLCSVGLDLPYAHANGYFGYEIPGVSGSDVGVLFTAPYADGLCDVYISLFCVGYSTCRGEAWTLIIHFSCFESWRIRKIYTFVIVVGWFANYELESMCWEKILAKVQLVSSHWSDGTERNVIQDDQTWIRDMNSGPP